MALVDTPQQPAEKGVLYSASRWLIRNWIPRLIAALILLIVVFYWEENWRGRRAWESCRHQLAARGENVDWPDFIPPSVPAADNIFEYGSMSKWFIGRGG